MTYLLLKRSDLLNRQLPELIRIFWSERHFKFLSDIAPMDDIIQLSSQAAFQESRYIGLEIQHQWSDQSIERTN